MGKRQNVKGKGNPPPPNFPPPPKFPRPHFQLLTKIFRYWFILCPSHVYRFDLVSPHIIVIIKTN